MERLTKRLEDGQAVMDCAACGVSWHKKRKKDIPYCTALFCRNRLKERLAAYEDTGLEPEEIKNGTAVLKWFEEHYGITAGRMMDLAQADKDGRLVVLPCKGGDTVYVTGECRIMECFIDEAYLDDRKGTEYLVSFDCDNNCEGCPFNDWHQEYSGEYSCNGEWGQASIKGSDIGKTVFLTREEAEAALARKGGAK